MVQKKKHNTVKLENREKHRSGRGGSIDDHRIDRFADIAPVFRKCASCTSMIVAVVFLSTLGVIVTIANSGR